jgi:hypothetical protein
MAMEVSNEVAGLFFVLTGERFPDANEDSLRELAAVWRNAAAGLRQLHAGIAAAVAQTRESFDGGAERAFAERMARWVDGAGLGPVPSGGPVVTSGGARRGGATSAGTVAAGPDGGLIGSAAVLCDSLADFLERLAEDVEYVKLVIIYQLTLLLFEIWLAYITSPFIGGGLWAWLKAKFVVVKRLMEHLLAQLAAQLVVAWVISSAFQLLVDVAAQTTQIYNGTRDEWNREHTSNAAQVAALGAGLTLFMGPVHGGIAAGVNAFGKMFQKDFTKFAAIYAAIQTEGIHESATDVLFKLMKEGKLSDTWGGSLTAGMTSSSASALGNHLGDTMPSVFGVREWLTSLIAIPGNGSPLPDPGGTSTGDPFSANPSSGGPLPNGPGAPPDGPPRSDGPPPPDDPSDTTFSDGSVPHHWSPDGPTLLDGATPPLPDPTLVPVSSTWVDSPPPPMPDHPALSPNALSSDPPPPESPAPTGQPPDASLDGPPTNSYVENAPENSGPLVIDEWWENAEQPAGEAMPDDAAPPRMVDREWWELPGATDPDWTTTTTNTIGDNGPTQPPTVPPAPGAGGEQPIVHNGTQPHAGDGSIHQPALSHVDGQLPDLTHGQLTDPAHGDPGTQGAALDHDAPTDGRPSLIIDTSVAQVANPLDHNLPDSPVSPMTPEDMTSTPTGPVSPISQTASVPPPAPPVAAAQAPAGPSEWPVSRSLADQFFRTDLRSGLRRYGKSEAEINSILADDQGMRDAFGKLTPSDRANTRKAADALAHVLVSHGLLPRVHGGAPPNNPAATGDSVATSDAAGPHTGPHAPPGAPRGDVQQIQDLLRSAPVDIGALFTLLHRASQPDGGPHMPGRINDLLSAARNDGRLSQRQMEQALLIAGVMDVFSLNPQALPHIESAAVPPGQDPAQLPQVRAVATALDQSIRERRFDQAAVILRNLGRDQQTIWAVQDAYRAQFSRDLRDGLLRLRPSEQPFIDHLLGATGAVPVRWEQAEQWFDHLGSLRFDHHERGQVRIPVNFADDGCYLRAHLWSLELNRLGASPAKVFAARTNPPLTVWTPYAPGSLMGDPAPVAWSFHVAPVVDVYGADGQPRPMVFDPVSADRPLTVDEWLQRMGVDNNRFFVTGTLPQVQAALEQDQQANPQRWTTLDDGYSMPSDRAVVVITDVHTSNFPSPDRPQPENWQDTDSWVRRRIDDLAEHGFVEVGRAQDLVDFNLGFLAQLSDAAAEQGSFQPTDLLGSLRQLASEMPVGSVGALQRDLDTTSTLYRLLPDHTAELNDLFPLLIDPQLLSTSVEMGGPAEGSPSISNVPVPDPAAAAGPVGGPHAGADVAEWGPRQPEEFSDDGPLTSAPTSPISPISPTEPADRAAGTPDRGDRSVPPQAPAAHPRERFGPGGRERRGDEILADGRWRRSPLKAGEVDPSAGMDAGWMKPLASPVARAEIDQVRASAPVVTVNTEIFDPVVGNTLRDRRDGGKFVDLAKPIRHKIAYQLRTMEVRPGQWVRERTIKVDLRMPKGAHGWSKDALISYAQEELDEFINLGYRAPDGAQIQLRVELAKRGDPDAIKVRAHPDADGINSLFNWYPRTWSRQRGVVAHEVGHAAGLIDEGVDKRFGPKGNRIFQARDPRESGHYGRDPRTGERHRVADLENNVAFGGLYGGELRDDHGNRVDSRTFLPRSAWRMENIRNSLVDERPAYYADLHANASAPPNAQVSAADDTDGDAGSDAVQWGPRQPEGLGDDVDELPSGLGRSGQEPAGETVDPAALAGSGAPVVSAADGSRPAVDVGGVLPAQPRLALSFTTPETTRELTPGSGRELAQGGRELAARVVLRRWAGRPLPGGGWAHVLYHDRPGLSRNKYRRYLRAGNMSTSLAESMRGELTRLADLGFPRVMVNAGDLPLRVQAGARTAVVRSKNEVLVDFADVGVVLDGQVMFEPGSARLVGGALSGPDFERLDSVLGRFVESAVRSKSAGLGLPSLLVVPDGSDGPALAQQRAERMAQIVMARVGELLADAQRQIPATERVSPDELVIREASELLVRFRPGAVGLLAGVPLPSPVALPGRSADEAAAGGGRPVAVGGLGGVSPGQPRLVLSFTTGRTKRDLTPGSGRELAQGGRELAARAVLLQWAGRPLPGGRWAEVLYHDRASISHHNNAGHRRAGIMSRSLAESTVGELRRLAGLGFPQVPPTLVEVSRVPAGPGAAVVQTINEVWVDFADLGVVFDTQVMFEPGSARFVGGALSGPDFERLDSVLGRFVESAVRRRSAGLELPSLAVVPDGSDGPALAQQRADQVAPIILARVRALLADAQRQIPAAERVSPDELEIWEASELLVRFRPGALGLLANVPLPSPEADSAGRFTGNQPRIGPSAFGQPQYRPTPYQVQEANQAGLRILDTAPSGDCFIVALNDSLGSIGFDLRAHMPVLGLPPTDSSVRRVLAERLVEWAFANPNFVAGAIDTPGNTLADARAAIERAGELNARNVPLGEGAGETAYTGNGITAMAFQLARAGSFANEGNDMAALMAVLAFGVGIRVVEETHTHEPFQAATPANAPVVTLVRLRTGGQHYFGTAHVATASGATASAHGGRGAETAQPTMPPDAASPTRPDSPREDSRPQDEPRSDHTAGEEIDDAPQQSPGEGATAPDSDMAGMQAFADDSPDDDARPDSGPDSGQWGRHQLSEFVDGGDLPMQLWPVSEGELPGGLGRYGQEPLGGTVDPARLTMDPAALTPSGPVTPVGPGAQAAAGSSSPVPPTRPLTTSVSRDSPVRDEPARVPDTSVLDFGGPARGDGSPLRLPAQPGMKVAYKKDSSAPRDGERARLEEAGVGLARRVALQRALGRALPSGPLAELSYPAGVDGQLNARGRERVQGTRNILVRSALGELARLADSGFPEVPTTAIGLRAGPGEAGSRLLEPGRTHVTSVDFAELDPGLDTHVVFVAGSAERLAGDQAGQNVAAIFDPTLERIARQAVARARQGLALPKVSVVSDPSEGAELATERAEAVLDSVRLNLGTLLAFEQPGTPPDQMVTAADLLVPVDSGGLVPFQRGVAGLAVDWGADPRPPAGHDAPATQQVGGTAIVLDLTALGMSGPTGAGALRLPPQPPLPLTSGHQALSAESRTRLEEAGRVLARRMALRHVLGETVPSGGLARLTYPAQGDLGKMMTGRLRRGRNVLLGSASNELARLANSGFPQMPLLVQSLDVNIGYGQRSGARPARPGAVSVEFTDFGSGFDAVVVVEPDSGRFVDSTRLDSVLMQIAQEAGRRRAQGLPLARVRLVADASDGPGPAGARARMVEDYVRTSLTTYLSGMPGNQSSDRPVTVADLDIAVVSDPPMRFQPGAVGLSVSWPDAAPTTAPDQRWPVPHHSLSHMDSQLPDLTNTDQPSEPAAPPPSATPPPGWIQVRSYDDGRIFYVHPDDFVKNEVRNKSGQLIGVTFVSPADPIYPSDKDWAESTDVHDKYVRTLPGESNIADAVNSGRHDVVSNAAWHGDYLDGGTGPIFVIAYSAPPDSIGASVRSGATVWHEGRFVRLPHEWRVRADAVATWRLLQSMQAFLDLWNAKPNASIVAIICDVGDGVFAPELMTAMQRDGFARRVHFGRGLSYAGATSGGLLGAFVSASDNSGFYTYHVDANGNHIRETASGTTYNDDEIAAHALIRLRAGGGPPAGSGQHHSSSHVDDQLADLAHHSQTPVGRRGLMPPGLAERTAAQPRVDFVVARGRPDYADPPDGVRADRRELMPPDVALRAAAPPRVDPTQAVGDPATERRQQTASPAPEAVRGADDAASGASPESDPGPLRRLEDVLPRDEWYRLYLDPRHLEFAERFFPFDPGSYYDHEKSPGFQASMVAAYERFLNSDDIGAQRLDFTVYREMHDAVNSQLPRKSEWSGGVGSTGLPLRAGEPSADLIEERLDGRPLLFVEDVTPGWEDNPITFFDKERDPPYIWTQYTRAEVERLVGLVFDQFYDDMSKARSDIERFKAIGWAVRTLHIMHPSEDTNRRLNVHLLLPRLLLDAGFKPVVFKDMDQWFQGGRSLDQIADALARGQSADLRDGLVRATEPEYSSDSETSSIGSAGGVAGELTETAYVTAKVAANEILARLGYVPPNADSPSFDTLSDMVAYVHHASGHDSAVELAARLAGGPTAEVDLDLPPDYLVAAARAKLHTLSTTHRNRVMTLAREIVRESQGDRPDGDAGRLYDGFVYRVAFRAYADSYASALALMGTLAGELVSDQQSEASSSGSDLLMMPARPAPGGR